MKMLFLEVEGLSLELVDKFKLKKIKNLLKDGSIYYLRDSNKLERELFWPSLYTGINNKKILKRFKSKNKKINKTLPSRLNDLRLPFLWEVLSQGGDKALLLGMPLTSNKTRIKDGYVIPGYPAKINKKTDFWPYARIFPREIKEYQKIFKKTKGKPDNFKNKFRFARSLYKQKIIFAKELLKQEKIDFFFTSISPLYDLVQKMKIKDGRSKQKLKMIYRWLEEVIFEFSGQFNEFKDVIIVAQNSFLFKKNKKTHKPGFLFLSSKKRKINPIQACLTHDIFNIILEEQGFSPDALPKIEIQRKKKKIVGTNDKDKEIIKRLKSLGYQ